MGTVPVSLVLLSTFADWFWATQWYQNQTVSCYICASYYWIFKVHRHLFKCEVWVYKKSVHPAALLCCHGTPIIANCAKQTLCLCKDFRCYRLFFCTAARDTCDSYPFLTWFFESGNKLWPQFQWSDRTGNGFWPCNCKLIYFSPFLSSSKYVTLKAI